jgi:hypothetical protein
VRLKLASFSVNLATLCLKSLTNVSAQGFRKLICVTIPLPTDSWSPDESLELEKQESENGTENSGGSSNGHCCKKDGICSQQVLRSHSMKSNNISGFSEASQPADKVSVVVIFVSLYKITWIFTSISSCSRVIHQLNSTFGRELVDSHSWR